MTDTIAPDRSAIRRRLETPLAYPWHAHGIGMLRTYLDVARTQRLNLWHSRLLNPGISTMHTHPRPFTSTVYAGLMTNKIYERSHAFGYPYREGIIHCGNDFKGIENDPPRVNLYLARQHDIRPGESYTQLPELIHDTAFVDGTVTVMEWDRSGQDTCASVFWADGLQWGDATRRIERDDILVVTAAALELLARIA